MPAVGPLNPAAGQDYPAPRRLPAEWEPHRSTVLCWPNLKNDWPGRFTPIPWVYTEIVKHLVPHELPLRAVAADRLRGLWRTTDGGAEWMRLSTG